MHIHQPPPQPRQLGLPGTLALGQAHQGDGLRLAVVQQRPAGVALQQGLQPAPEPGLAVLLQGQQRLVAPTGIDLGRPGAIRLAGHDHEAVQEVVAGIGIRLDVIEQHPRRRGQLRQRVGGGSIRGRQPLGPAAGLHPGLGHQVGGTVAVLVAMGRQGLGQLVGIAVRQLGQAVDARRQQHLAALAADAAHFAEMALAGGLLVAEAAPAAEHALLAVGHQGRHPIPGQIRGQPGQHLLQLGLQATTELEPLALQAIARARHHQGLGYGRPLVLAQQPSPQGQQQAVLAGEVAPLPAQHRPVGVLAPPARPGHPLQQGRVGLQGQTGRPPAPQPQAHHPRCAGGAGRLAVAGLLGQEALEAGQLVAEGQGAVGGPLALGRIPVAVEPGAAAAAQPAAQQPVGEHLLGHRCTLETGSPCQARSPPTGTG